MHIIYNYIFNNINPLVDIDIGLIYLKVSCSIIQMCLKITVTEIVLYSESWLAPRTNLSVEKYPLHIFNFFESRRTFLTGAFRHNGFSCRIWTDSPRLLCRQEILR